MNFVLQSDLLKSGYNFFFGIFPYKTKEKNLN